MISDEMINKIISDNANRTPGVIISRAAVAELAEHTLKLRAGIREVLLMEDDLSWKARETLEDLL